MDNYTLILADDHKLLRHGIRQILEKQGDHAVIGEAGDGLELLRLLTKITPDLILLDIAMPNLRGIEAAIEIKMLYPGIKILILSMHKSLQYVHHALSAGADGYLLKEDAPRELISAIETIRNQDTYISPLIRKELTNDLIQSYHKGSGGAPFEPLTVREAGGAQAHCRGKIQPGDRRSSEHQHRHGQAPPRCHQKKAGYPENRRPG